MGLFDNLKYRSMINTLGLTEEKFFNLSTQEKNEMLKMYEHLKKLIQGNKEVLKELYGTTDIKTLYNKYIKYPNRVKQLQKLNISLGVDEFFLMPISERNKLKERTSESLKEKKSPKEHLVETKKEMDSYSQKLAQLANKAMLGNESVFSVDEEFQPENYKSSGGNYTHKYSDNKTSANPADYRFIEILNLYEKEIQTTFYSDSTNIHVRPALERITRCFREVYGDNYYQFEHLLEMMGRDLILYVGSTDEKIHLELENKYIYNSKTQVDSQDDSHKITFS